MSNAPLKIDIESLPKALQEEVADFVAFLKSRKKTKSRLKERQAGYFKGKIKLSKDFDEPLDEFKKYM